MSRATRRSSCRSPAKRSTRAAHIFSCAAVRTKQSTAQPPKRVIISQFESLEKAVAAYKSPAYMEARKIGDKYAKFRIFAVEGVAPK